MTGKYAANLLS